MASASRALARELCAAARRPSELVALLRYKRKAERARAALAGTCGARWRYAYAALAAVSRSFAVVIMELQPALRHPVAVFYLVLRALDTVEDDTRVCGERRAALCRAFYTYLPAEGGGAEFGWGEGEFGEGAERELLDRFGEVVECYRELRPEFRAVIRNITRRMGAGMAEHIDDRACATTADYDLYCHYVAGLVGYGLSDMFAVSGFESPAFSARTALSNSMGLFLQKTNIVRDYLEDCVDGRTFWPEDVWGCYAATLSDFADARNRKVALPALNHMVTDALRHAPDCLEYMSHIRDRHVFNFVAIPQVMAIATLAECFGNGDVFERKVKIRRALTAKLVLRTRSMPALYGVFFEYAVGMLRRVDAADPNASATRARLNAIIDVCAPHVPAVPDLEIPNVLSIVAFLGLSSYALQRRAAHDDGAVFTWRSAGGIMEWTDMLAVALLFIVCIYLFSFFLLTPFSRAQMEESRRIEQARVASRRREEEAACAGAVVPSSASDVTSPRGGKPEPFHLEA